MQSAVKARRQGDENPKTIVVAETMKRLADNSKGYQIMGRSRHTVTKQISDEKRHGAIKSKMLKCLNHITDQLYEVDLVKSEIEPRQPILVGFFNLQYAKQRMLQLYYNFFKKTFVTLTSLKNLKWTQTHSTWLCRKRNSKTLFSLKSKMSGMRRVREIVQTLSLPTQQTISFPECVATDTKNGIRRNQVSLGKILDVHKCCVYAVKRIVARIERVTSTTFAAKV